MVKWKNKIQSYFNAKFGKYAWYNSFKDDYGFRVLAFTLGGVLINVAYAVFNGVTAIKYLSLWYGVFAGYYIVIALMRIGVLLSYKIAKKRCKDKADKLVRAKTKIYLANGAFLVVLDIALGATITVMLLRSKPTVTGEIMAITSAAYTTYKVVSAIRNIIKARHTNDKIILTIRDIGIADALASVVTLQTTLISTFGTMEAEMFTLSAIVGFVVCMFIVGLGSYMIINASKALKLNPQNNRQNFSADISDSTYTGENRNER